MANEEHVTLLGWRHGMGGGRQTLTLSRTDRREPERRGPWRREPDRRGPFKGDFIRDAIR